MRSSWLAAVPGLTVLIGLLFCLGLLVGCGGSEDPTAEEDEQAIVVHRGASDEGGIDVPPPPTAHEPYRGGSSGEHTLAPPKRPVDCPPACGGGANKPQ
jgi:hypothetical protein